MQRWRVLAIKTFTATEERIPVENQSLNQTAQTWEKKLVLEIIFTLLSSTWNSERVQSASLGALIMPLCDHTSHVTFYYQPITFGNTEQKRSFLKAWILLACYKQKFKWLTFFNVPDSATPIMFRVWINSFYMIGQLLGGAILEWTQKRGFATFFN